jgi:hypothetical protein
MSETEESTKVAHTPRETTTGALAGLFGAVVLLAVVASGLLLRPASHRSSNGAGTSPPADTPSVMSSGPTATAAPGASVGPGASASAAALAASATPQGVDPSNSADFDPSSSHRRHSKGKSRKHRETTSSLRAEP